MFGGRPKASLQPQSKQGAALLQMIEWPKSMMPSNVRGPLTVKAKNLNAWTVCETPKNYWRSAEQTEQQERFDWSRASHHPVRVTSGPAAPGSCRAAPTAGTLRTTAGAPYDFSRPYRPPANVHRSGSPRLMGHRLSRRHRAYRGGCRVCDEPKPYIIDSNRPQHHAVST